MVREDFSEEVTCKLGFEEMSETWTRRGEWGKTGLCEVTEDGEIQVPSKNGKKANVTEAQ